MMQYCAYPHNFMNLRNVKQVGGFNRVESEHSNISYILQLNSIIGK